MRRVLAVLALTVTGAVLAVAAAAPAQAHARLRTSSPAAGSTVTKPPAAVVLTFSTKVRERSVVVRVDGPGGTVASSGAPAVDGRVVTQPLVTGLANGAYTVRWKATANDGHQLTGTVPFTLKAAAAAASPAATASPSASATPSAVASTTPTTPAATPAASPAAQAPSDADLAADVQEDPATWPVVAALGATAAAVGGFVLLRRRAGSG